MVHNETISWLLEGDVAIRYQTYRDLLGVTKPKLQQKIANHGWGLQFLTNQKSNGHWGLGFYQPKWTSSHYTLLDLKNLAIQSDLPAISTIIHMILREEKGEDGGINPGKTVSKSDVCINGMFLNYATYFGADPSDLESVVDYILSQQLPDGGFNCQLSRKGATHSSLHSTISVVEGIREYAHHGYEYRLEALEKAELESREFMLEHRLYKSDKTGKIIDNRMTMLSYPCRWRYDILRALEYFQVAGADFDDRMEDAIELLKSKQRKDQTWPVQQKHPGKTHFDMEQTGKSSRWNTLRALKVLKHFSQPDQQMMMGIG